MSYTISFYVERMGNDDLERLDLEITGSVSHYEPAVTHLRPEDCHPAEGGEVEILSITLDGKEWEGELTEEEREQVEERLFELYRQDDGYIEEYEEDELDMIEEIPERW